MPTSAHCCCPARLGEALEVAERLRQQAADLPGAAQLLGAAVAGRAALGAGHLDTACVLLERAAGGLSASGDAIGWGYRYHIPRATALAMRGSTGEAAAALAARQTCGSLSVPGLRAEHGAGVGCRGPGRHQ